MNLGKLSKTEIWKFDIEDKDIPYSDVGDIVIGEIKITFTNEKFVKATFPFTGSYTKAQWNLLAQVSKKITEIEKQYQTSHEKDTP